MTSHWWLARSVVAIELSIAVSFSLGPDAGNWPIIQWVLTPVTDPSSNVKLQFSVMSISFFPTLSLIQHTLWWKIKSPTIRANGLILDFFSFMSSSTFPLGKLTLIIVIVCLFVQFPLIFLQCCWLSMSYSLLFVGDFLSGKPLSLLLICFYLFSVSCNLGLFFFLGGCIWVSWRAQMQFFSLLISIILERFFKKSSAVYVRWSNILLCRWC